MNLSQRITMNPEICHGKPTIRGLRYTVESILELLSSGMAVEEILSNYEDLERQDILAALDFARQLSQIKRIEAIYERGMIRPLQPLELAEGTRLDLIVVTHEPPKTNGNTAEIIAEIAALPLEGADDRFAGRDHDTILYPKNSVLRI